MLEEFKKSRKAVKYADRFTIYVPNGMGDKIRNILEMENIKANDLFVCSLLFYLKSKGIEFIGD